MNRPQFDNIFKIYKPVQHPDELYWLVQKVERLNPKIILEIGVQKGATLFVWNSVLSEKYHNKGDCLLIGIDLNNNLSWDARKSKTNIKLLVTDSRKKETIYIVKKLLQNRPIDFLFIDGNHSEDGVTSDYQNYSIFVRKGGLVALHDLYNKHYPGVKQFWDKVKGRKESCDHGIGIGTIQH